MQRATRREWDRGRKSEERDKRVTDRAHIEIGRGKRKSDLEADSAKMQRSNKRLGTFYMLPAYRSLVKLWPLHQEE